MKKHILLLIIISSLLSCEKDADIVFDEMEPTIVVESVISTNPEETNLRLTMTKGFKRNSYEYDPITDAQVSITDESGNSIPLTIDSEGNYKTTVPAIQNKKYILNIVKNQFHVTAEKIVPELVVLNDFNFVIVDNNDDPHQNLVLDFIDPSTETDYFIVEIYEYFNNDPNQRRFLEYYLVNDNNYRQSTHQLTIEYANAWNNFDYEIVLRHIDKQVYDYINTLKSVSRMRYGSSPFISIVPGNPNSNIQNGIGFFMATASSFKIKHVNIN
jgi:hypothetical protein